MEAETGSCCWEVRQGSTGAPRPLPTRLQERAGLLHLRTILEVRARTRYIMVCLVSCVLEKKLTHHICDFTEKIA